VAVDRLIGLAEWHVVEAFFGEDFERSVSLLILISAHVADLGIFLFRGFSFEFEDQRVLVVPAQYFFTFERGADLRIGNRLADLVAGRIGGSIPCLQTANRETGVPVCRIGVVRLVGVLDLFRLVRVQRAVIPAVFGARAGG
jgi:hypothetical protein